MSGDVMCARKSQVENSCGPLKNTSGSFNALAIGLKTKNKRKKKDQKAKTIANRKST